MRARTFRTLVLRRSAHRRMRSLWKNRPKVSSRHLSQWRPSSNANRLLRHELRTPLAGMLGMAELLEESAFSGEQRKFLSALQESGSQMKRLIEDTGAGATAIRKEPINGLQFLEQVIRAHWPAALKQGIGLHLLFDHRLSENWHSDPAGLRQLMDNLLANAIKFTPSGHVLVHARPSGGNQPNPVDVELRLYDTGIGIAPCDNRRIYSNFEQGSGGIRQRYGGSGLGLSVCRRITASLGGSLRHQPNKGGGTCFKVVFPGIANNTPNRDRFLRPGLLSGLRCRLGLPEPGNRVVAQSLLRMGVQVDSQRTDEPYGPPGGCDFMIADSSRIRKSIRAFQFADERCRPVLLSRWFQPDAMPDGDEQVIKQVELPEPLLYSNLQPLVLQIGIARAMAAEGGQRPGVY